MRWKDKNRQDSVVVAGVDVGSLYTKTVILDFSRNIIAESIIRSGASHEKAAEDSLDEVLKYAGLKTDELCYIISTGYGRARVPFANKEITEITCHAKAAKYIFPETHTIIDIGGQDSKVIQVDEEGRVKNFVMNDKCAAGTGRFLEVMAVALELSLDELSEISSQSKRKVEVSSMCTVFAESEVISLISMGHEKGDIAAAIFRAIARRITGMVGQLGLKEKVAVTGGVVKSKGMVCALEDKLRTSILIPEEPQIVGAWGAAMIALEQHFISFPKKA